MLKSIFILLAFIFVVFFPCLRADFINLDDDGHFLNNAAVHDLSLTSIKQIFTQTINHVYFPLTTLSFAVEKRFFGVNSFVFHLDNLLIYAGVVILVLLLAKRMGLPLGAGFLAALIFAVHPMKVESVAWVTERKDVLYGLFYLLALHQYWSYLKTLSLKYYLATLLFGILSILAKPMAWSLPLILLILDWFYQRRFSKRVIIEKVPFLVYVICFTWFNLSYESGLRDLHGFIIFQGAMIWVWSFVFYIWKFLYPFQVSPYYQLPYPVSIFHWPYLLSVIFFFGWVFLLVRFRKHKLFVFAFLYYFCSIFFLLRIDDKFFSIVSDRYMFLPCLGICFFVGEWIDRRISSRQGTIIFYILLVLMGVRTNLQCQIWHDSISFWSEIIREHPDHYKAYNNRGAAFYQQGRDDLALNDFDKAIALEPKAVRVYDNRGFVYYLKKEDSKALKDFNKAISLDPAFPVSYQYRSLLEKAQRKYP